MGKEDFAPLRGEDINTTQSPWEGSCKIKPWNYKITAAIPVIDTTETLDICSELLRLQTERPYIIIIDTGSSPLHVEKLKQMQSDDLEVHFLRLNGVQHPSDFPAMAMDVAFALCRTEFMFATHADCFLRNRNFLKELLDLAATKSPVVGYEMSPRAHNDWKGMVSHTATLFHMPTMDKIGFGWSLRRLCNIYSIQDYKPSPLRPNWPDTEVLGNYILRYYKIKPHLIGSEKNFSRQVDDNIDHLRSYTSGKLYSPPYFKQAKEWFEEARKEALERISLWKTETI
jgi:hypothetical protein